MSILNRDVYIQSLDLIGYVVGYEDERVQVAIEGAVEGSPVWAHMDDVMDLETRKPLRRHFLLPTELVRSFDKFADAMQAWDHPLSIRIEANAEAALSAARALDRTMRLMRLQSDVRLLTREEWVMFRDRENERRADL